MMRWELSCCTRPTAAACGAPMVRRNLRDRFTQRGGGAQAEGLNQVSCATTTTSTAPPPNAASGPHTDELAGQTTWGLLTRGSANQASSPLEGAAIVLKLLRTLNSLTCGT